ncbi:N-glycosylase/DNA lyase [Lachnotalea glycerini]|uniref:DNA-(apurinic or apyrimidinic site) lyase n=1 Tax=Lachnotalea glycerini TaxID=1763509 RepID=A0A255IKM7_9FIRM|nr:DNA glycosylase [Lachnotalea glycerini]PXV89355.1 N-glycosylase/DNA lyase [Lachnotalea glycerini]RDY30741.1 DNA-3-methyladenine glycosylase 2 family protein [Lachnotalea glycerini]
MKIKQENNNIILEEVDSFDIEQILECGQCFHFDKLEEKEYVLVAKDHLLHIKQVGEKITFYDTDEHTFETVWRSYFDLDRDYSQIKNWLIENEKRVLNQNGALEQVIIEKSGIRILNQDFFETLISFIISQNKQIPHIKQIVNTLSIKYGEPAGEINAKEYYCFPTIEKLSKVSDSEMRLCKTGFRAPYILNACEKILDGTIKEESLLNCSFRQAREELMQIKGVGSKVASCVALFSLSKRDAFPIDVWIKRIMERIYFEKETPKSEIEQFADRIYGEYGGYAQQYLFYYARDLGLK